MIKGDVYARRVGSAPLSAVVLVELPPWLSSPEDPSCRGADPALFFPEDYGLGRRAQIEEARALCSACPVRALCLEWAVAITDLEGVWAGTTPPQRRRIRTGKTLPSDRVA
jgi:hypothetical protein